MIEIVNSLLKSKNYTKGRHGRYPVDRIVIHVMEGTEESANAWFENERSDVSSNFGIAKVGRVEQYVKVQDTAWTQGLVDRPTAKVVLERPDANPNEYCVSIEFEGSGHEPLTPQQKISGAWLINYLADELHIPIDRDHVIGHHEIRASKPCPGAISVTELVQLAQGVVVPDDLPKIVYSPSLRDYLVVARYVSDDEWYFYPMKELTRGTRAGTRLSKMPLRP